MTAPKITDYPLKEVLEVKHRRVEVAESVLKEKKRLLEVEEEKLKERERERDKVLEHLAAKVNQLRAELDSGTTSDKIERSKRYIQVVQEKLAVEEKKVADQKAQVELAEKNVEIAKNQLKDREKERDKIIEHKKEWTKETLKLIQIEEIRAEDELGSTMFLSKMIQNREEERRPHSHPKKRRNNS